MLPSKKIWKTWSPIEKITYVAQLAAALALVPTTVFSWLSWRETRLAREDQARLFYAEKAPQLELNSVEIQDEFMVVATVKNTGGTTATDLRYRYNIFSNSNIKTNCRLRYAQEVSDSDVQKIEQGHERLFTLVDLTDLSQCNVHPKAFSIKPWKNYSISEDLPHFRISLLWLDMQANEHIRTYRVEIQE